MDNLNLPIPQWLSSKLRDCMTKTVHSEKQRKLAEIIHRQRKASGLTQTDVAERLGRHQPFIANIENGERRVDIIELIEIAEIIGLDVEDTIQQLRSR